MQVLPIETEFKLPWPLPTCPSGEGEGESCFASGIIDLGGLQICKVSTFTKVWSTHEGGPDNLGLTFFEPSPIPEGFSMLGCYSQPNNQPLYGSVLVGKQTIHGNPTGDDVLKPPIDYSLIWSSESCQITQDGVCYIWLPVPPDGYRAIGHVVTGSPDKPSLNKICCVKVDFTDVCEGVSWIWGIGEDDNYKNGINVFITEPCDMGIKGIPTGVFFALKNESVSLDMPHLKVRNGWSIKAVPNQGQIEEWFKVYSPRIYFHPDEPYFPSSVDWFFENEALLYTRGKESSPDFIDRIGSNLPQGGTNDGAYWIGLPMDNGKKEEVKKGNLTNACAYLHVKPMCGGSCTEIAVWLFYPFNGAARAKIWFKEFQIGEIGEHVGDWEHVTLRISNFDGKLLSVYFSQHNKGEWVDYPQLEFENGKLVVYSSLHGHASSSKPGVVLHGKAGIGIVDKYGKGKFSMDTGSKYMVVSADYLGPKYAEPPWLNYAREWGPKVSYKFDEEIMKVEKTLPDWLKKMFRRLVSKIPDELLGKEGPTGPKQKDSWTGEERT